MGEIKEFFNKYKGAIIGIILAVLILVTKIYELVIAIILIAIGAFIGNYIQKNKYDVKEKIKSFIDRM